MSRPVPEPQVASIVIPEVRDYQRINAELAQRLDEGSTCVRLVGAEGQRFLASGLRGTWHAVVEIEGAAGPELAAELNAPNLTVVCRGPAGDGAGRGLRAGRLVILGAVGDALGYAQEGGSLLAVASAAHRAGLNQRGGVVAILGAVGRLAGERQSGGWFFADDRLLGPHAGHGRRGGRFVRVSSQDRELADVDPEDAQVFRELLHDATPWTSSGTADPPPNP
jgi:glutamate synthase domain-containing protein 3